MGLAKSGRLDDARNILEPILKEDRNNIPAWRLYAETWQKKSDKVRVWEYCLRYNPSSRDAQQALAELKTGHIIKAPNQKKQSQTIHTNAPAKSRSVLWLVWGGLGMIVIIAVLGVIAVRNALPKDPEEYKHTQPVEYYLYVPKNILQTGNGPCSLAFMEQEVQVWNVGICGSLLLIKKALFCCAPPYQVMAEDIIRMWERIQFGPRSTL